MTKEPAILVKVIEEIIRAAIPMALIFGWVNWTDEQTGTVMVFIGVFVGGISMLITRSQVTPVTTANEQIQVGINSPKNTKVSEVIDAQKEGLDAVEQFNKNKSSN